MLKITETLAGYQPKTSATTSAIFNKPIGGKPAGATQAPGFPSLDNTKLQPIQDANTRQMALQTFSDPNFWRARAANRLGISTHDDPNVQRYLGQLQQSPPSHPGLKLLGAAGGLSLITNALSR